MTRFQWLHGYESSVNWEWKAFLSRIALRLVKLSINLSPSESQAQFFYGQGKSREKECWKLNQEKVMNDLAFFNFPLSALAASEWIFVSKKKAKRLKSEKTRVTKARWIWFVQ